MVLELPIEEGWLEIVRLVAVRLVEFSVSLEVLPKEDKVGVVECVDELWIAESVGVVTKLAFMELNGVVEEMELIEFDDVVEAFEMCEVDKDATGLKVLVNNWRLVFDEAFAWWAGATEFLLAEK